MYSVSDSCCDIILYLLSFFVKGRLRVATNRFWRFWTQGFVVFRMLFSVLFIIVVVQRL